MTLPEQNTRYVYAGPYSSGDTVPIPFSYAKSEHVKVAKNEEILRINIDYTVVGQNVTLLVPALGFETITIFRKTPLDNEAEFPQEAPFDSEKINDSIDKLTMQQQEQEDQIKRAIKLPINAPAEMEDLSLPFPEASKALKWNTEGTALINSTFDPDEVALSARQSAEDARRYAEEIQGITIDAEQAINAANDSHTYAEWSRRWAVGNPEPTQGSAKYWAQLANDTVAQGFSYFTQAEWDALTDTQKQGILLAFVKGE